jgi:hypothetical protein
LCGFVSLRSDLHGRLAPKVTEVDGVPGVPASEGYSAMEV